MSFTCFTQKQSFLFRAVGAMAILALLFLAVYKNQPSPTETFTVSTLAGGGEGFADGEGSIAQFDYPRAIAIDPAGNLYVTDSSRIRKVTPKGEVSTLAGSEESGFADGEGSVAQFRLPHGIAIDATGNLYVADTGNNRIRKVTPEGVVSTLAGSGETGYGGGGFADGEGSSAQFSSPHGIAIDVAGNLYVADSRNRRIRKVTPKGEVSTLVGGEWGFADGEGRNARFSYLEDITIDAAGNLYVDDYWNNCICKVTPKGEVSTLTKCGELGKVEGLVGFVVIEKLDFGHWDWLDFGNDVQFKGPLRIAIDAAGNLYVTELFNHGIRKVTPGGEVSTLVGGRGISDSGFADGEGNVARFWSPSGITIDAAGNLYVVDSGNHRIRKITLQRP